MITVTEADIISANQALKDAVSLAWYESESGNSEDVGFIFQFLLKYPAIFSLVEQGIDAFDKDDHQVKLLWVGVLGLLRIIHVEFNRHLKDESASSDQLTTRLAQFNKIYPRLKPEVAPPYTIDEISSIVWAAEINQDYISTFIKLGKIEEAHQLIFDTLHMLATLLGDSETVPRADIRNHLIQHTLNSDEHIYVGALSAKAVVEMRAARLDQSLGLLAQALATLVTYTELIFNEDRVTYFIDLAKSALTDIQWQGKEEEKLDLTSSLDALLKLQKAYHV